MKDNKQLNIMNQDPELPASLRSTRSHKAGMTIPEGFFEQFERKMNASIDAYEFAHQAESGNTVQPVAPEINWYKRPRLWVRIAACAVILLMAGVALQFSWFGPQVAGQVNEAMMLAEEESSIQDPLEPTQADEEFFTSNSDFEIYEQYYSEL